MRPTRAFSEYAETSRATATSSHSARRMSPPEALLGREADGVEDAVEPAPARRRGRSAAARRWAGSVTSISMTSTGVVELARRAACQRQPPPRARQHDLGPLGLGPAGHPEGQRRVGEHAGDRGSAFPTGARCSVTLRATLPERTVDRAPPSRPTRRPLNLGPEPLCQCVPMHVGILGGTGPLGRGLGLRLAAAGVVGDHRVARRPSAPPRSSAALHDRWPGRGLAIDGAANDEAAARCEVVVVATPVGRRGPHRAARSPSTSTARSWSRWPTPS